MNKQDKTVELAEKAMRHIMGVARTPIVHMRGNMIIKKFLADVGALKDDKPKKIEKE